MLATMFQKENDEKLSAGIFDGPQMMMIMKDHNFP